MLLAKLFVHEANLLILDEPTNDLDADTLELLEATLLAYKGTLILVSHDREFLNNVVTSCIAFDEDGEVRQYAGGYDDWLVQRPPREVDVGLSPTSSASIQTKKSAPALKAAVKKLSFNEQRMLDQLPDQIDALEQEQAELTEQMSAPSFFAGSRDEVAAVTKRLAELEDELTVLMTRWEELESRREGLAASS